MPNTESATARIKSYRLVGYDVKTGNVVFDWPNYAETYSVSETTVLKDDNAGGAQWKVIRKRDESTAAILRIDVSRIDVDRNYEWEIAYLNPDALQLVLRLTHGSRHCRALIIFDTAHFYGWQVGDRIAVDMGGMSIGRQVEKQMGMRMSEEDYTLFNQRTGGKAIIRKNDWECEHPSAWLKELEEKGLIPPADTEPPKAKP